MNRSTHQRLSLRQTRFVVRWDRILGGIILGLAVGIILVTGAIVGYGFESDGGLPPCTDAIADAGGMCHGPLVDTATVTPGDRVCVSMLNEDGSVVPEAYYCGPLVLTTHDDIAGEDRP